MELVIASAEFKDGNVLSFRAFPTQPYALGFLLTVHVSGEVQGEIAYCVKKWDHVIFQSQPKPFRAQQPEGQNKLTLSDSIQVAFPSQGTYSLDILFGDLVAFSLPFSVFDSSKRSDLEREIIYYLKANGGARSVEEITRGVYNPKILNKGNFAEISGKVYLALVRMQEVINTNPVGIASLAESMRASRWKLK